MSTKNQASSESGLSQHSMWILSCYIAASAATFCCSALERWQRSRASDRSCPTLFVSLFVSMTKWPNRSTRHVAWHRRTPNHNLFRSRTNYNGANPDPSYIPGWHLTLDGLASGVSVTLDIRVRQKNSWVDSGPGSLPSE